MFNTRALPPVAAWWLQVLHRGRLLTDPLGLFQRPLGEDWPDVVGSRALYLECQRECANNNWAMASESAFSQLLNLYVGRKLSRRTTRFPSDIKLSGRVCPRVQNGVHDFPSLQSCRRAFDKYLWSNYGFRGSWPQLYEDADANAPLSSVVVDPSLISETNAVSVLGVQIHSDAAAGQAGFNAVSDAPSLSRLEIWWGEKLNEGTLLPSHLQWAQDPLGSAWPDCVGSDALYVSYKEKITSKPFPKDKFLTALEELTDKALLKSTSFRLKGEGKHPDVSSRQSVITNIPPLFEARRDFKQVMKNKYGDGFNLLWSASTSNDGADQ